MKPAKLIVRMETGDPLDDLTFTVLEDIEQQTSPIALCIRLLLHEVAMAAKATTPVITKSG